VKLGDISVLNATNIDTSTRSSNAWRYLETSELKRNRIGEYRLLDGSSETWPSRAKRLVQPGTIVFSAVRPDQEHHGIISDGNQLVVSTGFATIDIKDDRYSNWFVYAYLSHPNVTKYLHNLASLSASAYPTLSFDDLAGLPIPDIAERDAENIAQGFRCIHDALSTKLEMKRKLLRLLELRFLQDFGHRQIVGQGVRADIGEQIANFGSVSFMEFIKPGISHFAGSREYAATADIGDLEISPALPRVTFDSKESRADMQPQDLSLWIAKMKNTRKRLFYLNNASSNDNIEILSTGMQGFQVEPEWFSFLFSSIFSTVFESQKNLLATGATQEAVNLADLAGIPFVLPDLKVVKEHQRFAMPIISKLKLMEQQARSIEQLIPRFLNYHFS